MTNIRRPFQKRGRYYNYEGEPAHGFMYHTIRIWLRSLLQKKEESLVQPHDWFVGSAHHVPSSIPLRITWIGHSTFLIQIGSATILTDPVFGNVSPFFKRLLPPSIAVNELPPIDALLISHNHWDHMNSATLNNLLPKMSKGTTLVPEGDSKWFKKRGFKRVYSSSWGDKQIVYAEYKDQLTNSYVTTRVIFTFLPAHHWSQRGLFDRNKSLWGSWMIECNGYTIYFGGDTAYAPHFKEIAQEFPNIDIALLPIGPCEPHSWLADTHMNAEQAGQAFLDLKAQHFIPMHWGTFNFGHDHFDMPLMRIKDWWQLNQDQLTSHTLHTLRVGGFAEFEEKLSLIQPFRRAATEQIYL